MAIAIPLSFGETHMNSDETKAALRNFVNMTIKGDADDEAGKLIHDVLQAKMQARINPVQAAAPTEPEVTED
jgi:hypothetical protein